MESNSVCNHTRDKQIGFCYHSYMYDYRPNWTPLSPITITNRVFCAWSMRFNFNLNFKYVARAEYFVREFVTRDQRNIATLTDEAVIPAKLVL